MRKLAIFNYSGKSPNKGGPAGYLVHLYSGFHDNAPDFLCMTENGQEKKSISKSAKRKLNDRITLLYEIKNIFSIIKKGLKVRKKYRHIINTYDVVHIHDSRSVFYIKFFAGYKGRIILTPHRPEKLADEVVNSIKNVHPGNFRFLYWILNRIEKYSYKNADAFIFPSENAAKIYNEFPGFLEGSKGKPIRYLITGLKYRTPTKSKNDYFTEHNIKYAKDRKIVSYIGRHNYIKGYDRVVDAFDTILKHGASVIVAGAPGVISYPNDENWTELGYITDAMNLMHLSDVIIIPNRNTYFDLVIIEALSLGKIVITSNTGGNIDIAKDCSGLVLFDNSEENSCSQQIEHVLSMSNEEKSKLETSSKQYYEQNCTPEIFASNYTLAVNNLIKLFGQPKE